MDAEAQQRKEMLDVVVKNMVNGGAITLDDFLGPSDAQSLLSAGSSSGGQERSEGRDVPASDSTQELPSETARAVAMSKSISLPLTSADAGVAGEMDDHTRQIEECCMEWRAGKVKPYWLPIFEPKLGRTQGCVLRLQVSAQTAKVYSVEPTYETGAAAKQACAQAAIEQGVLDFIRHGDGQTAPAVKMGPDDDESFSGEPILPGLEDVQSWTVQAFYEALPRPFPEPVGDKSATDINGPAWLNTNIQAARGSRLVSNFIWTTDGKTGLHGVLLRLERPGESKSWLVAARFSKRTEAKAAVCLLAMSDGVGQYIRAIIKEVDDRLTAAMRKSINDILLPMLLTEYRKLWPSGVPEFEYQNDADACGCTMTIALCENATPEQVRKYTTAPDFRNRADAKLGVVALAVQQGVVDFIRFQGRPPPPGYTPISLQQFTGFGSGSGSAQTQNQNRKRKNDADAPGAPPSDAQRKKARYNGAPQGQFGGPSCFQGARPQMGHSPAVGMWMGAPPPAYPTYPAQHTQSPSYAQPYPGAVINGDSYNVHAAQFPASPTPYPLAPGTPYAYSSPAPATAPYPTPYPQAPPAYPSPYQATGYPQPYQQPFPPPLPQPQHSAPPPQVQVAPQPYAHASPQHQAYTPHTTGAPVMYTLPAPVPAPPPAYPAQPPHHQPYAIPIPPTAGLPPYAHPPVHYPPPPVPSILPIQRFGADVPPRERKRAPGAGGGHANGHGNGVRGAGVPVAPRSSVTELYDHCAAHKLGTPQFGNEVVAGGAAGESAHKVWIVIGKQKYEIPATFGSLSAGQERVAKRVLEQLRS